MLRRICQVGLVLACFFFTGALWAENRLGALGIGVSDLQASTAFYAEVLQLEVLRTYELGYLNEVVLGYSESSGAVLVLMHWPEQQRDSLKCYTYPSAQVVGKSSSISYTRRQSHGKPPDSSPSCWM